MGGRGHSEYCCVVSLCQHLTRKRNYFVKNKLCFRIGAFNALSVCLSGCLSVSLSLPPLSLLFFSSRYSIHNTINNGLYRRLIAAV